MDVVEANKLASECLSCKNKPCRNGCPLSNDITDFISYIKVGEYRKAYDILLDTTVLQPICGRICPHSKQCQGSCVKGIKGKAVNIGRLEAFIGDMAISEGWAIDLKCEAEKKNKKIAIVGGGPAGLTASAYLARRGFEVCIYEKHDTLGGLLSHGIPDFRLPKDVVNETIQKILDLGVKVVLGSEIGKNLALDELKENYDAILLCFGANIGTKMEIEGEDLDGVYGGNELLESEKFPDFMGKTVCIIGGGNTAVDTARTIKRKNAKKVIVIYRRAREQMPAEDEEVEMAEREGIEFLFQNNIVRILGESKVEKIECIKTELVKVDGDRDKPVNIQGSNYLMDTDYVVMALGSKVENSVIEQLRLETTDKGYIRVNENLMTSEDKIFSAGDLIGNKATVAWAARSGRDAARHIEEYVM